MEDGVEVIRRSLVRNADRLTSNMGYDSSFSMVPALADDECAFAR